jgi:hypothetical protein
VLRDDTIESIAEKVGLDPRQTLKQIEQNRVQKLRAGQVLEFEQPSDFFRGVAQEGLGSSLLTLGNQIYGQTGNVVEDFQQFVQDSMRGVANAGDTQFGEEFRQFMQGAYTEGLGPAFLQGAAQTFGGGADGGLATGPDGQPVPGQVGGTLTPADEASRVGDIALDPRDPNYPAELAAIGASSEKWNTPSDDLHGMTPRGYTALAARWTGQAVHHWALTGDEAARPTIITGAVFDQFPDTYQEIVRDYMGYRQDAEGDWRRIDFNEADYGMGGYDYGGGYNLGGFGGGGDYEYLSRGGKRRPRHGGGKSRAQVRQMSVGGMAPAHWRI